MRVGIFNGIGLKLVNLLSILKVNIIIGIVIHGEELMTRLEVRRSMVKSDFSAIGNSFFI